ncbi:HAD family hydrolase [Frankia sp. AgKG'84/4]|uniref:HAD family hydrolase n=1 Tax=Frankia sp. AgKG'84/4 TaxID=573490 RepID=UPI00200EE80C|nr:HAD family hydrolase [Frankia sp. AgKG'84/4]MCL9792926.1 HAD-IB family hydrolase [Frankia sp. AgKG'84/4]
MGTEPARVAFFDVDETLITVKGMLSFLEFHLDAPDRYRQIADRLHRLAADGAPREETNRLYYEVFAGQRETEVAASGRRWFQREMVGGSLFHGELVRVLRRLQAAGTITVLVSGSFSACLGPIAEHLGADHVLGTVPEVRAGRYTGRVLRTVIGEGKATAARALLAEFGVDGRRCVAYGDHSSDLPMLLAVGHAGVVGQDPVLLAHAAERGWDRLPGIPTRREGKA